MQRNRRYTQAKPFVSGGVYTSSQNSNEQQNQQPAQQLSTPSRQQQVRNQQVSQNQQTPQQQKQQQKNQKDQQDETQDEKPSTPEPPILVPDNEEDVEMGTKCEGNGDENNDNENGGTPEKKGKIGFKNIFLIRKKSSVRARERKVRQNRQLRKAITPKNALMALNEVKGIQLSEFVFSNNPNGGFIATVTVNNNEYEGKGISKTSAKNDACEKALRDYVIAKMVSKPRLLRKNSEGNMVEAMDAEDDQNDGDGDGDGDDKESVKNSSGLSDEQDDVPMLNLASFALFKLFSEWESNGFHVPEMHHSHPDTASNGTAEPKEPKKAPLRSELPPKWEAMHPTTLLCMMRPGIQYSDAGAFGEKPNVMQKLCVTIDDQEFSGTGRSKKVARRNAAVSALNTLFGTNFEEELPANA